MDLLGCILSCFVSVWHSLERNWTLGSSPRLTLAQPMVQTTRALAPSKTIWQLLSQHKVLVIPRSNQMRIRPAHPSIHNPLRSLPRMISTMLLMNMHLALMEGGDHCLMHLHLVRPVSNCQCCRYLLSTQTWRYLLSTQTWRAGLGPQWAVENQHLWSCLTMWLVARRRVKMNLLSSYHRFRILSQVCCASQKMDLIEINVTCQSTMIALRGISFHRQHSNLSDFSRCETRSSYFALSQWIHGMTRTKYRNFLLQPATTSCRPPPAALVPPGAPRRPLLVKRSKTMHALSSEHKAGLLPQLASL